MKTLEKLLTENRMPHDQSPRENPGNGLHGLKDLCDDHVTKDTVMAEIGCFRGASTELFAMHCKKIFAIDPWGLIVSEGAVDPRGYALDHRIDMRIWGGGDAVQEVFEDRMSHYDNVEIIKGFSVSVAEQFRDESLDLVYIDGNHARKEVKADMLAWYPKIKHGGVLCGHDYGSHHVKKGIELWEEETGMKFQRQPRRGRGYRDGSWRLVVDEQVGAHMGHVHFVDSNVELKNE